MNELIDKIFLKRYRVDAFLGKGGMADVFKVWDQTRSTYLAMKVLDPKLAKDGVFIANFKQEAEILRSIQHPNIVRFFGLEESENLVFMLMEFVEGQTLRQEILRIAQPFDSQKTIKIMRPICAALNYAHHLGFVHCDIKPANIMLHTNGTVLLADFGISRLAGSAGSKLQGVGTPAYMAPEQIKGRAPGPDTDIYAVGILLFEILTGGKRPFTGQHAHTSGTTTEKIRWEQCYLSPPSPRQYHPFISSSLEAVVMHCLEKRPEQRFKSVLDFQNALEEALAKSVIHIGDTAKRGESASSIVNVNTNNFPEKERKSKVKAFWLGIPILISILIVFALVIGSNQGVNYPTIQNLSKPIATPTTWQTPMPTWDTYTSTGLGFSIEYPPSWVYQEQETNPVIVIASSQEALNSKGYVSNGAAVAIAYTPLGQVDLPTSVDINSPESILDYFMAENFDRPSLRGTIESTRFGSYPAASAVYITDKTNQGKEIILYGVAVVTPETLTLLLGICPEVEWSIYQPVFDRMRDSLKFNQP